MSAQSIAERLRNNAPAVSRPKVAATMIEAADTVEALLEALQQCNAVLTALTSGTPDPSGSDIITHYQMCVDAELKSRAAIASAEGGGQ